jgi:hypothetical protein
MFNDLNDQDKWVIGLTISVIGIISAIRPTWIPALIFLTVFIGISILNYRSLHLKEEFSNTVFRKHLWGARKIHILNTFSPNFDDEFKNILLKSLDNGIDIKVLLLNPQCEEVRHRNKTLPEWNNNIVETIKQNINFLQEIYNETEIDNKKLLQLKLYRSWAPFSLYSTNRGASVGFFMNGTLAVKGPQLVITKNTRYFKKFTEQFDKIWGTEEMLFDFSRNEPMRVLDECYR